MTESRARQPTITMACCSRAKARRQRSRRHEIAERARAAGCGFGTDDLAEAFAAHAHSERIRGAADSSGEVGGASSRDDRGGGGGRRGVSA